MRALVLTELGKLGIEQMPDPHPAADEVVIRPLTTGICGSDIHGYTGANGRRVPGQVMGHETVGQVEEFGANALLASGVELGDVVVVNPVIGCGQCGLCLSGNPQACAAKTVIGVSQSYISAFAELMVAPAANIVPLPAGTPIEYGALVEPLSVGYHAAVRGGVGVGARVLIIGGGPIGQACLLAAQRLGATGVLVSEPNTYRRALCSKLGALVMDPASLDDVPAAVIELLGDVPTVILDAVGTGPSLNAAFSCAPLMCTIVLVGMGQQLLEVPAFEVSTKERTVVGSFCYTPEEFEATANWVGTCEQDLGVLIQKRVPLTEADEAFSELAEGEASLSKVMVMVQE